MLDTDYFVRILSVLQAFTGLGKELTTIKIMPFGELKDDKGSLLHGTVKGNIIFLALLQDVEEMRRTLIHEFFDYIAVKYAVKPLLDVLNKLLEKREEQIRGSKETLVESVVNAFETPEWTRLWKRLRYEGRPVLKVSRVKRMKCGLTLANVMIMGKNYSYFRLARFRLLTSRRLKTREEVPFDNLNIFEPHDKTNYDEMTLHKLTVPVAKKAELTKPDSWLLEREAQHLRKDQVQECVDLAFRGMDVIWPTGVRLALLPDELKKGEIEK